MAKDGTMRGGARRGAGGKPKELREKLLDGKTATVLKTPELDVPDNLEGIEMPKVDEWLKEAQQNGEPWQAEDLVRETHKFLRGFGIQDLVTIQQIYAYAIPQARWIQCQRAINKYGFLAKHPTTGAPIESPYVKMVDKFAKQAAAAWYMIYQIIRENCTEAYDGAAPHEKAMAALLSD